MILLAGVAAVAAVLTMRRGRRPRMRLRRLPSPRGGMSRRALVAVGAAAALVILVVAGTAGALVLAIAVAVAVVRRVARRPQAAGGDVALALDLLAGCLESGAAMPAAVAAAAVAAPRRVAQVLHEAATALARGDDPGKTWAAVGHAVPALAPAARACARVAMSGAAVAPELQRAAAAERTRRHTARRRRLQRATVWFVLPLGTCFLPAFVLVGVVPLVVGSVPGLLR